jgi:DNA-binding CsgD family transcriptional regulator
MRRNVRRRKDGDRHLVVTSRQSQILRLASDGLTDKEVASRLSISVSTVRSHLGRLYAANGLRNKTEAVAAWLTQGQTERRKEG